MESLQRLCEHRSNRFSVRSLFFGAQSSAESQKIPFTEADLTEGADYIKSSIKTELFISEFGQEDGLRVRAENDPQVIAALNQLPKAKELAENARKIVAQRAAAQQSNR